MGKMLAITDKQSCSPACSDSHHYPGKSIMRHGRGGGGKWIHLAATFNQWQHPRWQLSARLTSAFKAILTGGAKAGGGGDSVVSFLYHVVVIM